MFNQDDKIYMQRCIDLAMLGIGEAAPNPMVGSVIMHNGKIIGEGYHKKCGKPHAEANAINSVKDQSLLKESTIYVNLEPCAHFGKTPPCANLIVEKKIPRVVLGCIDSFAKVAGKGIAILKNAGCTVDVGILETECIDLNRRFFTFHEKKRPYIILKWAQTLDGFIDVERKPGEAIESYWITNQLAKMLVHKWRTEESAFMVGANTVLNDNPQLTSREWSGKNPIRIVPDKDLSLPNTLQIFNNEAPTIVFNQLKDEKKGNIQFAKVDFDKSLNINIMKRLHELEIQSVVIEGGRKLLQSFINENLWDEARVFTGNRYFKKGTQAPKFKGFQDSETMVGDCWLRVYSHLETRRT
jgi:diaminohydroxyphosphoribosylaminopyrimidine deaminase / 5-amino-6-(5-phosphoribosylamino)uracil reductase